MVKQFQTIGSKPPVKAIKFLGEFLIQFIHGLSVEDLFGLIYLDTFKSDQAKTCILDSFNIDLNLINIDAAALKDLKDQTSGNYVFTASGSSYIDTASNISNLSTGSKSKTKKIQTGSSLFCGRCLGKYHTSLHCTAPAPVFPNSLDTFLVKARSGMPWYAYSPINIDPTDYCLNTGSTLHLSDNLSHFSRFVLCSGPLSRICSSALDIQGTGTSIFKNKTGKIFTLNEAAYVMAAIKNLIFVKKATLAFSIPFSFHGKGCYVERDQVVLITPDSHYKLDYSVILMLAGPTNYTGVCYAVAAWACPLLTLCGCM